jgi:predicted dehydrogenase
VLPFFPEFAYARQLIAGGEYGKLLGGNFKRVISDPMWLKDFYDPKRVGGPMLDLHVHDAHFIRLLFGMPDGVTTQGRIRGEVVDYFDTLFHYADPSIVVRATSGVINQQGREFTHGFEIHLERATLHFEFAGFKDGPEVMPLKVLTADGKVVRPQLGDGDPVRGFEGEIAEVVRCVQNGHPSAILSGDLARDAVVMCHRQTESARERRTVKI